MSVLTIILDSAIRQANIEMMQGEIEVTRYRRSSILHAILLVLLETQPNGINADMSLRNAAGYTPSELVRVLYNNTINPVLVS